MLLHVFVDFLEVGVHDIVFGGLGAISLRIRTGGAFLLRLVHGFAQLHRGLGQGIGLGFDVGDVVALQGFLQRVDGGFDRALFFRAHLVAMLGQGLLGGVHQRVALVAGFDHGLALFVLGLVGFGVLDHLLDVGVRQAARGLDAD